MLKVCPEKVCLIVIPPKIAHYIPTRWSCKLIASDNYNLLVQNCTIFKCSVKTRPRYREDTKLVSLVRARVSGREQKHIRPQNRQVPSIFARANFFQSKTTAEQRSKTLIQAGEGNREEI